MKNDSISKKSVSKLDEKFFKLLRDDVSSLLSVSAKKYDKEGLIVLDIAPQDHEGAKPYFKKSSIETLDLDPSSGATYIADICKENKSIIPAKRFDIVICTEVLEHTLQPFDAVKEISRILKDDGIAVVSTPFNFRIHGPLPDCWRFTEHGLRELFKEFKDLDLRSLDIDDRFLMPLHYTLIARK